MAALCSHAVRFGIEFKLAMREFISARDAGNLLKGPERSTAISDGAERSEEVCLACAFPNSPAGYFLFSPAVFGSNLMEAELMQ